MLVSDRTYAWGANESRELGMNHCHNTNLPHKLNLSDITEISCGLAHMVAMTNNSRVLYVWGINIYGNLGLGNDEPQRLPQKLDLSWLIGKDEIKSVSCGYNHTVMLTKSNSGSKSKVYTWGFNSHGQLGFGYVYPDRKNSPQEIILPEIIVLVSSGYAHTIALTNDQNLYGWGHNTNGQLGLGYWYDQYLPQKLVLCESIVSIACGGDHAIAITNNAQLYVWSFPLEKWAQIVVGNWD